jgi:hypothetical protein
MQLTSLPSNKEDKSGEGNKSSWEGAQIEVITPRVYDILVSWVTACAYIVV